MAALVHTNLLLAMVNHDVTCNLHILCLGCFGMLSVADSMATSAMGLQGTARRCLEAMETAATSAVLHADAKHCVMPSRTYCKQHPRYQEGDHLNLDLDQVAELLC